MKRDRNHEGYHDPTACRAVIRADRARRRYAAGVQHLTYQLQEVRGFREASRILSDRG